MSEFDSTLIRCGRTAVTYADMVQFAATLEDRPIAQLLVELPDVARLSAAKFDVATSVLRRRFRNEQPVEQAQLRIFGSEIAADLDDTSVARRIRRVFE
ncbi:MAG TPA: hypothetical protein VF980_07050 [Thermoanaerobaculia bacterium]|jgi:hypothetical protein